MTESMGDGLDFVTTVHRPGLPDVHLGFRFQHQAEHASWSLTSDLTNTTHVVGTTISWGSRPRGVAVLPPVPADAGLIAELIRQEDYHGDPEQFPDLYSRLKAQEGFERGGEIWSSACTWFDHDDVVEEAAEPEVDQIGSAIAVLAASDRYSVKDNQTGKWVA